MIKRVTEAMEVAETAYWRSSGATDMTDETVPMEVLARAAIEAMKPLPRELFTSNVSSYSDERGNSYEDHAEWWADVINAAIDPTP